MRKLVYVFIIILAFCSCDDTKVGYLLVDDAAYDPTSMEIHWASELDPDADEERIRLQYPWISPEVQGVLGTLPLEYYIQDIHTEDGDVDSFKKYVSMRVGDGVFEIPYDHQVKKGTYIIDVNIQNEGYSYTRDSLFSIIVK